MAEKCESMGYPDDVLIGAVIGKCPYIYTLTVVCGSFKRKVDECLYLVNDTQCKWLVLDMSHEISIVSTLIQE